MFYPHDIERLGLTWSVGNLQYIVVTHATMPKVVYITHRLVGLYNIFFVQVSLFTIFVSTVSRRPFNDGADYIIPFFLRIPATYK